MVAGNTLLRLIGLAPDTYFFVVLFLLCLAFIGGRLAVVSKYLRNLYDLLKAGADHKAAAHVTAQPTPSASSFSSDAPVRRRGTTGRAYPHRRAARFASRRAAQPAS